MPKILLLLMSHLIHLASTSPFPDRMLHGTDETTVLSELHRVGHHTTSIPRQLQASKQIPLHSLMLQKCNFSQIDSYTLPPQYGLVGFQSKTYTQHYFPQGRYYHSIAEYDQHCSCPYTRDFTWNPESHWSTLNSGEFLNRQNRIDVIKFKTLRKTHYEILTYTSKHFQDAREIAAIQSTYINDISVIIPFIIASFYETSTWVKWKVEITHTNNITNTTIKRNKPCQIPIENLMSPFSYQTKAEILKHKNARKIPLCNTTDFTQIQTINDDTTKITIPAGRFRIIPIKQKRSIIHLGWGLSNIFQWDNWQLQNGIKIPSWYVITIVNGPMRKNKVAIHFALQNLQSYLMTIPNAMLDESLLPKNTFMAYYQQNKYCKRISSAKTDMYNALNINQIECTNCFPYYNNTETCAKKQEPQCNTFTLEHQGDNLQPPAERPRNGATFETSDPFSDLRDSAVDKNGSVQSISPDKQILRQVGNKFTSVFLKVVST